jgi:photosystem II stability/assembly factor-like uncharacterized protein
MMKARSFGVGFIDELHGYVGTLNSGYETTDGGANWQKVDIGRAANKIRVYNFSKKTLSLYAIGVNVYQLKIDK